MVVGRAELIDFPSLNIQDVPAKIDTGAYSTSIHASNVREQDGKLYFTLFSPEMPYYTGDEHSTAEYDKVLVTNSFGNSERRYRTQLSIKIAGKRINAAVNLADRSKNNFPVLVGRKLLRGKFLVDVAKDNSIPDDGEEEG